MKKARPWLIVLLIILVAAAVGTYYYYTAVYLPAQVEPEPALQTARVRTGDMVISITGAGNLEPSAEVSVGFRSGGVLVEVNAALGEAVESQQVLARLDDTSLRLQLAQSQLNLQAFVSPEAILTAEVAALNAETALEKAVEDLDFLISPAIRQWETKLALAQAELKQLQTTAGTSQDRLAAAQKAVESAQVNLKQAQYRYETEYIPATFTYTYTDLATGEELTGIFPPTEADVALARAQAQSAELAVEETQAYAEYLKLGQPCSTEQPLTAAEGSLLYKLEQACLDVEEINLALENTSLVAPIAGVITDLNANVGQAVGASPIVTISTLEQLQLRIYIEETDMALLKPGQLVRATFDAYPDQAVSGEITRIEPALRTVDGTPVVVAWATLERPENLNLLSGMAAEVEIIAGESLGALLVPVQALRELAPGSFAVFAVQPDGQLKLTLVTVGLKDFANAEILSGLEAGDVVSTGTLETK